MDGKASEVRGKSSIGKLLLLEEIGQVTDKTLRKRPAGLIYSKLGEKEDLVVLAR